MPERVAFIGLGTMGYPMAGHLARKGFVTSVYNRTAAVSRRWGEQYGEYSVVVADNVAAAVEQAEVVVTCLGNDDDVRQLTGEILKAVGANTVLVDHTTTSATLAEELAAVARKKGVQFLDAPVSGGQAGAEQGKLAVMVGGDPAAFEAVNSVLESYAQTMTYIGDSGSGQRCKMVNQLCVAGVLQGLSEGLALAQRVGIPAETVLAALQQGAGSSWQMVNRTQSMMQGEFGFGFAVDWMRKDLGICLDEADRQGLALPLARMVDKTYQSLQEKGYQRCDTSVLIRQFEDE